MLDALDATRCGKHQARTDNLALCVLSVIGPFDSWGRRLYRRPGGCPSADPQTGPPKDAEAGLGKQAAGGAQADWRGGERGSEWEGAGVNCHRGPRGSLTACAHTHLGREIGSQTHTHTHITLTLYHLFSRPPLPKHRDLWPSLATGAPLCMPPADPQPPSLRPCAHAQIRGRLDFSYHH